MIFSLLFLLSHAQASTTELLQKYQNNYYQAEYYLQKFDQELAKADRENFLDYSKNYPALTQLKIERDQLKEEILNEFSQETLNHLEPTWDFSPLEQLAFNDLTLELKKIYFEIRGKNLSALNTLSLENQLLLKKIFQNEINAELSRFTQIEKIYPSPGSNGNMFGKDFPMNTFAFTFDDGPSDKYTLSHAAQLLEHKKPATFFWLAENVLKFPEIVDKIGSLGFPRENHSFTHAQLPKLDDAQLSHEIIGSQEVLTKAYGEAPKFFRCPYGSGLNVARVRQMIADQNMIHVYWTIDSLDWQDKDPNSIFARVKKEMTLENRGIILFHDIHPQTLGAVDLVLKYSDSLENTHGRLRWVSIPKIVDEINRRP